MKKIGGLFKKKKKRVCLIGLDGVPCWLLRELASSGIMPFTACLLEQGYLRQMKASLPEISAVSWTDFMTGSNSGHHGIFGFTDFKSNSYATYFPNFTDVKTRTIWERLAENGLKSIVLNQPATYPARPIDGILLSGFVAVDLSRSIYPLKYLVHLEKIGYRTDIDIPACRKNHRLLESELRLTLDKLEELRSRFWREEWNYFEFVVTGTDRLHHFLWTAYADKKHPDHEIFINFYRQVDQVIYNISQDFKNIGGDLSNFFLISDHGFTGITQEVSLNNWLEENGYLKYSVNTPQSFAETTPETVAFALDPSRIYLNFKEKFPHGTVDEKDRANILSEISRKLSGLEFQGQKVVREIFDARKLYTGPLNEKGPDLVVLAEPGFDLKGSLKRQAIFSRTDLEGMHTRDDAFFWNTEEISGDLLIENVAGLIMKKFDLEA